LWSSLTQGDKSTFVIILIKHLDAIFCIVIDLADDTWHYMWSWIHPSLWYHLPVPCGGEIVTASGKVKVDVFGCSWMDFTTKSYSVSESKEGDQVDASMEIIVLTVPRHDRYVPSSGVVAKLASEEHECFFFALP
jgi:hypothetical protein